MGLLESAMPSVAGFVPCSIAYPRPLVWKSVARAMPRCSAGVSSSTGVSPA